ncbi:alpha/beta hydrolase [Rhizobacter sp. AJA081-3]|uniref:alpha/beta fold hydrolase n=1 Tax=Rhizobacter sp. AJA081-3 TaxID=2753607 RepID=UPI001AE05DA1|nr:alpha/beta hydrolase [Rhizobacter sp. AJA081-3]QTN22341.1 alpha/beta hydrolase [Rhizobacter sp. AJA081-3]
MTIETFTATLPGGIELSCRAAGPIGAPLLMFLHGFPEAAFVWDGMLEHFAPRYRCIAPNLRGYERSSAPADAQSYRAKHLVGDIRALIEQQGGRAAALIAHDWGGALAWGLAAQHPESIERLVIVNSPHPATFLRELRDNAQQQASSAYMNFLCRPDAEKLLAENDFARLWTFFERMGATDPAHPGGGWLTEAVRERYREVWRRGLTGGCNYYRASPLRPPLTADDTIMSLQLPPEMLTVRVPTLVIWAEADTALPPALLDGLEAYVPDMRLVRVPGATHWIVHERPSLVAQEIDRVLSS